MRKLLLGCIGALATFSVLPLHAASIRVELTSVLWGGGQEAISAGLSGVVTGTYDDGAGIVTMDAGTIEAEFRINPLPTSLLYWHYLTDSSWDLGAGTVSLSEWSCVDGPFGSTVGASLCGNISGGANLTVDSILDYTTIPGTRTVVGDDVVLGDMQQGADYGVFFSSWAGGQLVAQATGWESGDTDNPAGYQLVFQVVPVPTALWLFGSALGLLGWMRRKSRVA
jgi:hypothetical protein